ncbi:MAG: hypothetical protein ACRDDF_04530 [Aeromonas sp.]
MLDELENKLSKIGCSDYIVEDLNNGLFFIGTHSDYIEYEENLEDDYELSEITSVRNYEDSLKFISDLEEILKTSQRITVIYKDCSERTFFIKDNSELDKILGNRYIDFYTVGDSKEENY